MSNVRYTLFVSWLASLCALVLLNLGQDGCDTEDRDGDGWTTEDGDCNDNDANIHPGADELCDGRDNNCDDVADSGVTGSDETCAADSCIAILDELGEVEDAVYWLAPYGEAFEAYCDMSHDDGGWTLLLSANGSSTYWGNNSEYWWSETYDEEVPNGLVDQDYQARAYAELPTNEIRLCYVDADTCFVFEHGYQLSLLDFFLTDTMFALYSYDSTGIDDAGESSSVEAYLEAMGMTTHDVSCMWLGVNNTTAYSAIGLMGDWNCGCQSYADENSTCYDSGYPYDDDLAVGVGLQSCYDANECPRGGSGHAAGQSRGIGGVDDSGIYGPWFVFGR